MLVISFADILNEVDEVSDLLPCFFLFAPKYIKKSAMH